MNGRTKLVLGVGSALMTVWASAATINVPNGSFESPALAVAPPYAGSTIDVWQKAPVPAWWSGAGYSSDQWRDAGGLFVNVDPTYNTPIDNADGNQVAFLFSPPGYELFQDLTDTYQTGQAYQLTVGMEGGGYGMALGVPLAINLYYRDAGSNRVVIASVLAPNTTASPDQTHLTDYQVNLPIVNATDAWAGKAIGIQLASAATFENTGGFWVVDNVRLESQVPEPSCLAGMGLLALLLAWRRSA